MENTRIIYLQCGVYKSTGGGSDQLGFIVVLESTFLEPAESPQRICLLRASSTSSSLGPSLLPATSGASSSLPLHTTASRSIPVYGTIKCNRVLIYSSTLASKPTLATGNIRSVFTSSTSLSLRQPKLFLMPVRSGVFLLLNPSFHYSMPRNLSKPNPGVINIWSVCRPPQLPKLFLVHL